jgi:integrase
MKRAAWPKADQRLWLAAITPADPFSSSGGSRAAHRPISNRNIERGYGRWLTFLARRGMLQETAAPADRITPELVRAYLQELDVLRNKKNSILVRLEELIEMAKIMGPKRDWAFIKRFSARVQSRPNDIPRKEVRLVGTDELLGLGLKLMEAAASHAKPLRSAILYRDGLIIALLSLRPLRLRNFARLTLGEDLISLESTWFILLSPEKTKTHATLHYEWPKQLTSALDTYLRVHRPVLLARNGRWRAPVGDRLWVSWDASPLTEAGVYQQVKYRTRKAFGRPVNPHLFRHAGATTLAIHDPAHVLMAAALLGHRTFNTTEGSYILAKSLEAHRQYSDKLIRLRSEFAK